MQKPENERDISRSSRSSKVGKLSITDIKPDVYNELRRLAGEYMRHERTNHTLQATALVHEAYLRLAQRFAHESNSWPSRADFCAAAAQTIRWILIDHARARIAFKRGGPDTQRLALDTTHLSTSFSETDLLELEEVLTQLASLFPRQARVVELRFYGGLTVEEIAQTLGLSRRTVQDDWRGARAWLQRELAL